MRESRWVMIKMGRFSYAQVCNSTEKSESGVRPRPVAYE